MQKHREMILALAAKNALHVIEREAIGNLIKRSLGTPKGVLTMISYLDSSYRGYQDNPDNPERKVMQVEVRLNDRLEIHAISSTEEFSDEQQKIVEAFRPKLTKYMGHKDLELEWATLGVRDNIAILVQKKLDGGLTPELEDLENGLCLLLEAEGKTQLLLGQHLPYFFEKVTGHAVELIKMKEDGSGVRRFLIVDGAEKEV